MKKLGVGVVGSDVHVGGYIEAFTAHPKVKLIGACDSDAETAKDLAAHRSRKFSATDYEELLENNDIDIRAVVSGMN